MEESRLCLPTSSQSAKQQARDGRALTHRLVYGSCNAEESEEYCKELVQPFLDKVDSIVRTMLQFRPPESSISNLCKVFVEAVELALMLRKQRTDHSVGFADDAKSRPGAMLDCTGSGVVMEGKKIRLIVFPILWKHVHGAGGGKSVKDCCERAMGALRRRLLIIASLR